MEKSRENEILKILSVALRRIFSSEIYDYNKLQEIRLRMNEPLIVIYDNREYFVTEKGKRTTECKKAYMVAPADIRETLEYISNYSLFAYVICNHFHLSVPSSANTRKASAFLI